MRLEDSLRRRLTNLEPKGIRRESCLSITECIDVRWPSVALALEIDE